MSSLPNAKPDVVVAVVVAAGGEAAPNRLPPWLAAATPPNDGVAPNKLLDVVFAGVPNANVCDDGVPNENPPVMPVAEFAVDVVLGVPNWKPLPAMPVAAPVVPDADPPNENTPPTPVAAAGADVVLGVPK